MESETEPHELSAEFIFCCPGFQHDGPLVTSLVLGFLHVPLLPQELHQVGLLLCLVSSLQGHVKVVTAKLNLSHGTINVRRVYTPQFCLVTTKIWSD